MVDQLTEAYADFLQGSYDCPDRIVLTAYHRVASSAGGFRYWWRRLYETDENLDKTHLIRLAGRFHRRVKAYAAKHDIPVLEGPLAKRKHELAEQYKPDDPTFVGLFLIIISRASGVVWDVKQTSDGRTHSLTKHYRAINHIFFHLMDPQWGHVTIRISSHPPFAAMVILNGHEYLARQAHQAGRALELTGNCFTGIMSAADLTWLAETSGELPLKGQLGQVCQRWLYSCLHNASQLAQKVRELLGWNESQYQPRHASDDLKKLRGKNWVHKVDHSRRYEPVTSGLKIMAALLTWRDKVIKPLLASLTKPKSEPNPSPRTDLDLQYGKVQTEMRTLLLMLGVAV